MVNGEYKGFTVTQQQDNYGTPLLHIWCAYSEGKDFDILKECMEKLDNMAKTIEANKITFGSSREGWAKQAINLGFKPNPTITYEKVINGN